MAIRLISINGGTTEEKIVTLAADTMDDVPETGAETEVIDFTGKIGFGSMIITLDRGEVAGLPSDDVWSWW